MAEALPVKTDGKSALCNGVGQYLPKFHMQRDVPHQLFLHG